MKESGHKDCHYINKKREKYFNNYEYKSAQAVDLTDFNDEGFLFDKNDEVENENKDDLVPFNQTYRSPIL